MGTESDDSKAYGNLYSAPPKRQAFSELHNVATYCGENHKCNMMTAGFSLGTSDQAVQI
jgi:hypothetical protein